MRNTRVIGRVVAIGAVAAGIVAVAIVLFGGDGGSYRVKANFQSASQIVKGNLVQVSGRAVGEVEQIDLTDNGEAELTLKIEEDYAPLRQGTQATIRQSSLSGVANRYIDLRLAGANASEIPEGGTIEQKDTTTAVDLDQLFNIFGPEERKALSGVIQGSATQYGGRGAEANKGFLYLNPTLVASRRLFEELNHNGGADLTKFINKTAPLVSHIAERRADLAGLISNLAATTQAIGNQRDSLADAIARLPAFMRRANTTFVNLRATLDDLEPLIDESKPVARQLRPFLRELRPLARDALPTVRDLSALIRRSGVNNDLIDLTRTSSPLQDIAIGPVQANGESREGAFPATVNALRTATPEIGYARPYAVDLTGWFDDFSHSGIYDALGGASRAATHVNFITLINGQPTGPAITPALRGAGFKDAAALDQDNRCPGSSERDTGDGSQPFRPDPSYNCDPTQVPIGP